jgi:hypothetical protein
MANKTGNAAAHNPLACIRDSLTDDDQRVVIRNVIRLHVHSELGVDLAFELQHPFERDAASDMIRDRVEAAHKAEATRSVKVVSRGGRGVESVVNDNNTTTTTKSVASRLEHPTDTEGEYASRLLSEAEDAHGVKDGFSVDMTARKKFETINRITLRGGQHRSNEAERENVINLGLVKAMSTSVKSMPVYRASLSDNSIKWFAGQDHVVAEKSGGTYTGLKAPPPPANPTVEGSPAVRAATPVVPYVIMDAKSALVTFIKRFCDDMPDIHERMKPVVTEKADKTVRYYQIDIPLVEEAKEKILYTVYAQMYYTRLPDCFIARRVENELSEESIALKLAADWGLPVDPKTKRISDWSADAYRPVVVITLRVIYTIVSGVSATAATFFRTRTRVVPVKGQ